MHRTVEPAILYFGTPVVLVSSENEDGTRQRGADVLGLVARLELHAGLRRALEDAGQHPAHRRVRPQSASVDQVVRSTGWPAPPAPTRCRRTRWRWGIGYEHDKLGTAGLTAVPSELVSPPRLLECPVQIEATLEGSHSILARDEVPAGKLIALEVRIRRVHVEESLLMDGHDDRIDPLNWRPLIMSFCQFFGLSGERSTTRGWRRSRSPPTACPARGRWPRPPSSSPLRAAVPRL